MAAGTLILLEIGLIVSTEQIPVAAQHYLVRWGVQGEVGRFRPLDATPYHRGQRVLCQTPRGVFVGNVLNGLPPNRPTTDTLIRAMGVDDELLQARLEKFKLSAVEACRARIEELGSDVRLLDVDHAFDGRTLWFHFLGEVPEEIEHLASQLGEEYERLAKVDEFAELLEHGCGPGCGTKEKQGGCGTSGGCSTCQVGKICRK